MPLSPPADRVHLHTRTIDIRGYGRADGQIDIEAHLTDVQSPKAPPGEPRGAPSRVVHDMWLRFTVSRRLEITGCEAAMDQTPYSICPAVAPNFARLVGLRIEGGFVRRALERVGGAEGCTHLRELMQQLGTVAYQTMYAIGALTDDPAKLAGARPPLLNTCHAWSESGPVIRDKYPDFYRAPEAAIGAA